MSSDLTPCPNCGRPVPRDAPANLCPGCLVAGGFSEEDPLGGKAASTSTLHIVIPEDALLPQGAPQRLGSYEILEMIAHGGMGIVYKARHTGLDRVVAIKMIRSGVLASPRDVERFQREARSAAKLHHPNIVTIHDIGEQDGQHYFSMDYVPGKNLAELARTRPFSPGQAAEITAGVTAAIHYAHQHGVLHRDIKPANVILTPELNPRVLDFGLALVLADDSKLTVSGTPMGSPSYMPPEQAAGQTRNTDARSDVYSLGAMLYELLTGRPPFQAASTVETLQLVVENEAVPPRRLNPALPRDLETICLKCLEKAPDRRYQTAQELGDELGRFLRDEPIFARPVPAVEKVWRWGRRKPLVAGLSAAVVAALVIAIAFAFLAYTTRLSRLEEALATKEAQEKHNQVLKTQQEERRVRDSDIPRIRQLIASEQLVPAFQLAQAAKLILPDDPELVAVRKQLVAKTMITSEPSGARVWIRDWQATNEGRWLELGRTPLQEVEVPQSPRDEEPWQTNQGIFRWRLEKNGYQTRELNAFSGEIAKMSPIYMPEDASVPDGMVYMPAARDDDAKLDDFWIDRFEVTNRQFQEFVDAGGYERHKYWEHEFLQNGKTIPREEALQMLRDSTGKPGPALWADGRYSGGEGDYPVRGVSWYEAAAYARFSGKSLPTVHHWRWAANIEIARCIVPLSNFSGQGPTRVGSHHGIGRFDAYDMAGNVAEWCWNESQDHRRSLRGGAWDDPGYVFTSADALPPLDRSPRLGFRCVKYLKQPSAEKLSPPPDAFRDFARETPASPEQIKQYLAHYQYFPDPLNARRSVEQLEAYVHETIRIESAYKEEFDIHLFLPHHGRPPYEPIVVVPDAGAFHEERFVVPPGPTSKYSMGLLDEGRAICWPVLKGMYGRRQPPSEPADSRERDLIILIAKDLSRTIDYLQTRPDMDLDRLTFFGGSWGAVFGPTLLVAEPRFKAAILNAGGYMRQKKLPEVEPFQFAPYVKVPILMLNGRYDPNSTLDALQKPFYRDLGSQDKRHVLFNSRHAPPIDQALETMNEWLREKLRGTAGDPNPQ